MIVFHTVCERARWAEFPELCQICGLLCPSGMGICLPCQDELPWQAPGCRQCGILLPSPDKGRQRCKKCQQSPPAFDHAQAIFEYCTPVMELIAAFKYRHHFVAGNALGRLMSAAFLAHYAQDDRPDLIIPVPLHASRLRRRGFNQALELAKILGKQAGIPVSTRCVTRRRCSSSQQGLTALERAANMTDAFELHERGRPVPACVAIIDDVVTTGATANALARTLRRGGAQRIDVWALARVN